MTHLERLLKRRESWQRELNRGGTFAAQAPAIIAALDLQIAELAAPLRNIERIERDPKRPGWARLTLACGHVQELADFPRGTPPPCFRRRCAVPGCGNA